MKRLLFIFFSFLLVKLNLAQSGLKVVNNKTVAGKNLVTNTDILAKEYVFPRRIHKYLINQKTQTLTVQLREDSGSKKKSANPGYLLSYNLESNKINWSREADYSESRFLLYEKTIIESTGHSSSGLNMETGNTQWEAINSIYYVDQTLPIGLGYKRILYNSNKADLKNIFSALEGTYLRNGKLLWKREIDREFGWNEVLHLRDSILLIAAAGLHSIDLRNGKGWDYIAVTGHKEKNSTFFKNLLAASVAVLNNSGYYITTEYDIIWNIASNVIVDGSYIYFASRDKISKLDFSGKLIWSHPLPATITSKSSIFLNENSLYLINRGYAFKGNSPVKFGMPFIAAYNINSGGEIFLQNISDKQEEVRGYTMRDKELYVLFKNRLSKYSLINGKPQSQKIWDEKMFGDMMYFVSKEMYLKTDSTFNSLASIDSVNLYVLTDAHKTLVINNNFDVSGQFEPHQLFHYYLKKNDFKFLANANKTVVIDGNNKTVAEFKASKNAILLDTKMYDIQKNSFTETDLSELIKN